MSASALCGLHALMMPMPDIGGRCWYCVRDMQAAWTLDQPPAAPIWWTNELGDPRRDYIPDYGPELEPAQIAEWLSTGRGELWIRQQFQVPAGAASNHVVADFRDDDCGREIKGECGCSWSCLWSDDEWRNRTLLDDASPHEGRDPLTGSIIPAKAKTPSRNR